MDDQNKEKEAIESQEACCLNCKTMVITNFCGNCGQSIRVGPLSFKFIGKKALELFFEFNGPFAKTVIGMFLRPGELIADYVSGKRVNYADPLKYSMIMASLSLFCGLVLTNNLEAKDVFDQMAQEGDKNTRFVWDIVNQAHKYFITYISIITISSAPILGLIFRVIFHKSGRNVAEHTVFGLYIYGQGFAIQAITYLLGLHVSSMVSQVLSFIWIVWASITFNKTNRISGTLRSTLAFSIYFIYLIVVYIIIIAFLIIRNI